MSQYYNHYDEQRGGGSGLGGALLGGAALAGASMIPGVNKGIRSAARFMQTPAKGAQHVGQVSDAVGRGLDKVADFGQAGERSIRDAMGAVRSDLGAMNARRVMGGNDAAAASHLQQLRQLAASSNSPAEFRANAIKMGITDERVLDALGEQYKIMRSARAPVQANMQDALASRMGKVATPGQASLVDDIQRGIAGLDDAGFAKYASRLGIKDEAALQQLAQAHKAIQGTRGPTRTNMEYSLANQLNGAARAARG